MQVLGLLTGMIQAYIFIVLAMVYIASATSVVKRKQEWKRRSKHDRSYRHRPSGTDRYGIIITSGLTVALGASITALAEGGPRRRAQLHCPTARQANTISRSMFVGLAMVGSNAIYSLVVALVLIFVNPFWNYFISQVGG